MVQAGALEDATETFCPTMRPSNVHVGRKLASVLPIA